MAPISAGILLFRISDNTPEIFLVHPGGPFFKNKDIGVWTIPKGLSNEHEDLDKAAIREFEEETGFKPKGKLISLGSIKQKGGKIVHAWAVEGELPENFILESNSFEMTWPPRTAQKAKFPEIDQAEFFPLEIAKRKIIPEQVPFIERLLEFINKTKY